MRRRLLSGLLLLFITGQAFASVPGSYDYRVKQSDDFGVISGLGRGDTLSFKYWFDYTGDFKPTYLGELDLIVHDAGVKRDDILYGDGFTMVHVVNNRHESRGWVKETVDVPFWLYEDAEGNRREDPLTLLLNVDTWLINDQGGRGRGHPNDGLMSVYYISDIETSFSEDRNGPRHRRKRDCNDQPVPEPGTLAMLGSGLLGLIGFELKRRRASN